MTVQPLYMCAFHPHAPRRARLLRISRPAGGTQSHPTPRFCGLPPAAGVWLRPAAHRSGASEGRPKNAKNFRGPAQGTGDCR